MVTTQPRAGDTGAHPATIIEVSHVTKTFVSPDGSPLPVLDDISLDLREGEIVALLGRSGSGKSTLLRCIAGLIAPTAGTVSYRGQTLNGANPGVAMVFQSFALLPWLTVRQNVELGLEALGTEPRSGASEPSERSTLSAWTVSSPLTRRNSRVGCANEWGSRGALVVEPDALLMDEPFSALDVLTAQNLRAELLRLWQQKDFPTKAMLIVTHNIEEAVILADRIFVLGANPGRIRTEISCMLPQPRNRHDESFGALVDQIYGLMTGRDTRPPAHIWTQAAPGEGSPVDTPLPQASVGGMSGLLEILVAHGGREDLPKLAHELTFEVDDLLPLVDAAQVLGLAEVDDADLQVTDDGRTFVAADILESKQIFARRARERAPLVRAICNALETTEDGNLGEGFFLDLLRRGFSEDEARQQLRIAIDWGRYGELFDFDANSGQLSLDHTWTWADN